MINAAPVSIGVAQLSRNGEEIFMAEINTTTPLMGMRIHFDRAKDIPCSKCGQSVVVIAPGGRPDTASLSCAICDHHRGWLPPAYVNFLSEIISRFGRPSKSITVRNSEFAQANAKSRPAEK